MRLTTANIRKIDPPEKGYSLHWDDGLKGFGLRVTAAGARSFIVEARVHGKTRRTTVGKLGTFTPDEARKLAKTKLGEMAAGNDPAATKRERKSQAVTLADVADDYKVNRRTNAGLPLKASSKADIDKHLRTTFSDWRDRPIAGITREMVSRRYAERCKRSVAQANQAFRVLRALINYAAAKHRDTEDRPIITENPVKVLRDASMLRAVPKRRNFIPLDQIGRWWSAVQAMRSSGDLTKASQTAADLIALLALTGLRVGEARALRWNQVDQDDASLRLMDTKNRTDITLPLSTAALDILKTRPSESKWIFPARSGDGHLIDVRGQLKALADQTEIEVTPHDLRRTFRAVAAACNVELWRTKALMNHKQNQDVTLANYTDLSDVRNLKPDSERIARYYEDYRITFESSNVFRLTECRA